MNFQVILYQPEIPPNTGNIIRLCANSGCELHLIRPLGFTLEEKQLVRAGLDYHDLTNLKIHDNFANYLTKNQPVRIFACTTKGSTNYTSIHYQANDAFLFGPESKGLPQEIRDQIPFSQHIYIPMKTSTRSLNLSNAAAIIIYEAWRQCEFL